MDKPILWVGGSLGDLRGFPEDARRIAGFEKRSRKTPTTEIDVARARLREALTTRRRVR